MNPIVEAFIKDHANGPLTEKCGHVVFSDKDVRALIAQLIPEGSVVVPRAHIQALEHCANEWADMATNGIQAVRNIRDGIQTCDELEQSLLNDLVHCQEVSKAARSNPIPAAEPSGRVCEYCNKIHKDSRVASPEMNRAKPGEQIAAEPKCESELQSWIDHNYTQAEQRGPEDRVVCIFKLEALFEGKRLVPDCATPSSAPQFLTAKQEESLLAAGMQSRTLLEDGACHEGPTPGTEKGESNAGSI